MDTLTYIFDKYRLNRQAKSPIEIPNAGRNDLAEWLHELNFKVSVEVGVAAGVYSQILCLANPQMRLYGVDLWKPYKGYRDYTRKNTFKKLYDEAVARLSQYPNYIFLTEFSMDALARFGDNSLDFVYLDANHEDPFVTQDITQWYKKVKPGGILAGHDYITRKNNVCDVIGATNRFTRLENISPWFIIGTSAKLPGTIRDSSRSWMWVKT